MTKLVLFQSMTDTELYTMFITLGPIVSAKIMRDKSSGYSFGYGFVQYESPEDAARAIEQLNGLQVANNKRIKVSYSRPNTADIKDTNLYVGNVPAGITEADLDSLFGNYGSILTKKLLKDSPSNWSENQQLSPPMTQKKSITISSSTLWVLGQRRVLLQQKCIFFSVSMSGLEMLLKT